MGMEVLRTTALRPAGRSASKSPHRSNKSECERREARQAGALANAKHDGDLVDMVGRVHVV
jgi:hypothetical protein